MRVSVSVAAAVEVKGIKSSRTGVTGGCDPPTMGAANQTLIFWKNNSAFHCQTASPKSQESDRGLVILP